MGLPKTVVAGEFLESTTIRLTCQATQEDGVTPLGSGDLTTLTLTLHDQNNNVINGKDGTDIKNANNGTIDGSGNIALVLLRADTALAVATAAKEVRTALIAWTWEAGAKHAAHEIIFTLRNAGKYP